MWSFVTFLVIVVLGAASKGVTGRGRHLTFIDAGAGMDVGVARRYRGFYAARSTSLDVRASDRASFVWLADIDEVESVAGVRLVAERDGVRLSRVPALPWSTVVVREEGVASLGEGIGLATDASGQLTIDNGTRGALLNVLVKDERDEHYYFPRIERGQQVAARDGRALSPSSRWVRETTTGQTAGRLTVHPLQAWGLDTFDAPDENFARAWQAIERAPSRGPVDWLPRGVPVLLAQIEGGEGVLEDTGFILESDRVLVRVLGYGR